MHSERAFPRNVRAGARKIGWTVLVLAATPRDFGTPGEQDFE
jgi:hypothetical protein